MLYMLDTNICIYLIKRRFDGLITRMRAFRTGELGLSVITVSELQFGVEKSAQRDRNQSALEAFLLPFDVAEFSVDAAVTYGRVRKELEAIGMPIGPMDTLIAAHALTLDVTLVTNNTREFDRVRGLKTEDWTL